MHHWNVSHSVSHVRRSTVKCATGPGFLLPAVLDACACVCIQL